MKLSSIVSVLFFILVAACASSNKATSTSTTTETSKKDTVLAPTSPAPDSSSATNAESSNANKKSKKVKPTETSATAGVVTCTSGSDTRTIEVVSTESGGCETKYTKAGTTNSVGTAHVGTQHCSDISGKIKTNLEAAKFSCN